MVFFVCKDVEVEPVLQDITGEELNRGDNTAPDARLDIYNIYLTGFLITLSPNGPFASKSYLQSSYYKN